MKGFFSPSVIQTRKTPLLLVPQCGKCGLSKLCKSPKMPISGRGERKILLVGEYPGKEEDLRGRPFVGASGNLLKEALKEHGVNLERDCWSTNSLICHPKGDPPSNAVDFCRPNLVNTIKGLKPEIIILLGANAVKSLIGWLWKGDTKGIGRWVGWSIPCQRLNTWIFPNYNPAHLLYAKDREEGVVLKSYFSKYLEEAVFQSERPWKKVPDYRKGIRVIMNQEEATLAIQQMTNEGNPIAFDYETDRLKPDHKDAGIVSCSLSDGKQTIAYPFHGKTVEATKEFLFSDVPKIGWHLQFEDRWTRRIFGRGVKNWMWDGMLAAHVLDNRPDICSLKFQAFVRLGMESYDESIKPFLKADGSNLQNRIKEVDLAKLLLYNGLDSLLTYKIAMMQMKELGYE